MKSEKGEGRKEGWKMEGDSIEGWVMIKGPKKRWSWCDRWGWGRKVGRMQDEGGERRS